MSIIAKNIHVTYPAPSPQQPDTDLFRDLSLAVAKGETHAVMGASGSGKSTLCYLLAGLSRLTGGTMTGEAHVAGFPVHNQSPPPGVIGSLFQDAATQLFNHTAESEVAWGLEAMGVPPREIGPQVASALAHFGLLDERYRPPWALSGGQQKRLALASVWAMRPQVLLLDEPLGGLDPAGQREVLESLTNLHRQGNTVLLTTQRLDVAALASQPWLLEAGTISPLPAGALQLPSQRLIQAGVLYPPDQWPDLTPAQEPGRDIVVELEHVRFRYPDGHTALRDVNLSIPRGQFVALIGANGAGKTTLARHLNGLLTPAQGTLRILGRETSKRSIGELARSVSFLFQRPEQQLFSATVRAEVAYGPRQLHLPNLIERVEAALTRFNLNDVADIPPAILSYGAQRAVTLAALAALDAPILILDEPIVGLDGRGRARLLNWLAERRAAGVTLILITHEMPLAARADRVVLLENGHIIADGLPSAIIPQWVSTEAS